MEDIKIIREPSIKHKDIIIRNLEAQETFAKRNTSIITSSMGILCPLVTINDLVIPPSDIIYFSLSFNNFLPSLKLHFKDNSLISESLNNELMDNNINVQIIPPKDNTYKKINLDFYTIDRKSSSGGIIMINALYKLNKLTDNRYEGLGLKSTYELIDLISKETGLGMVSNINNTNDKQYIYCDYKSYYDIILNKLSYSEVTDNILIDSWIDPWNYINIINIKKYMDTHIDLSKNYIWDFGPNENMEDSINFKYYKVPPTFTNLASIGQGALRINHYEKINNVFSNIMGTDRIYTTYMIDKGEYEDLYLVNKSAKKDKFIKMIYSGESYGDYDYINAYNKRKSLLEKYSLEKLNLFFDKPLFGVMRGMKIDLILYNDSEEKKNLYNNLTNYNAINKNENIKEIKNDYNTQLSIDESLSGQYYVESTNLIFEKGKFEYIVTISRPIDKKTTTLLKDKQTGNN